jgi:hypothetical protein
MKPNQKDIVEINVELPNGRFLTHPVLIISNEDVYNAEDIFYGVMLSTKKTNEDFIFELKPTDFNYSTTISSFAKCQLIGKFKDFEILRRVGSLKQQAFDDLIRFLNQSVFSFICK